MQSTSCTSTACAFLSCGSPLSVLNVDTSGLPSRLLVFMVLSRCRSLGGRQTFLPQNGRAIIVAPPQMNITTYGNSYCLIAASTSAARKAVKSRYTPPAGGEECVTSCKLFLVSMLLLFDTNITSFELCCGNSDHGPWHKGQSTTFNKLIHSSSYNFQKLLSKVKEFLLVVFTNK